MGPVGALGVILMYVSIAGRETVLGTAAAALVGLVWGTATADMGMDMRMGMGMGMGIDMGGPVMLRGFSMRRDEEASNVVLASSIMRVAGRGEICIAMVGGWCRNAPVSSVEEGLSVACGVGGESGMVVCVRKRWSVFGAVGAVQGRGVGLTDDRGDDMGKKRF
jgi:hypothetical protein